MDNQSNDKTGPLLSINEYKEISLKVAPLFLKLMTALGLEMGDNIVVFFMIAARFAGSMEFSKEHWDKLVVLMDKERQSELDYLNKDNNKAKMVKMFLEDSPHITEKELMIKEIDARQDFINRIEFLLSDKEPEAIKLPDNGILFPTHKRVQ